MANRSIGGVSIDVTADLSTFTRSLQTGVVDAVKRISPLKVTIDADVDAAQAKIMSLGDVVRAEQAKVEVNAETDAALNAIHSLSEVALAEMAQVEVTADTGAAVAGIQDLGTVAAQLAPAVDVTANTDTARADIQDLGKPVTFPVDAIADFSKVIAEKEELAKPVTVPVSTSDRGGGGGTSSGAAKFGGLASGAVTVASILDSLSGVGDVDQALGRIAVNAEFAGGKIGDVDAQLKSLKDTAAELGADPRYGKFDTSDFIKASEILTKANVSIEDTKKLLPAVGDLAVVSGQDIETATAQLAQFRQVLQVKPGDEKNVVDILTNADIAGTFGSINDYSTALGYVGLQYTNMIDPAKRGTEAVKELLGTLTFADNAGVRVDKLGTTLQSFFSDISGGGGSAAQKQIVALTDAFEKQQGVLKDGGDIFFKGNGQLRDMVEIQRNLAESTSRLNPLVKSQVLNTIFQTDSQQLANALLADNNGELAHQVELMDKQGYAAKYAANATEGYKGATEGLKGSLGGLSQSLGDLLKGPAEKALRGVGSFIGEISGALAALDTGGLKGLSEALGNLSGPAKIAAGVIASFGAAAAIALAPMAAAAVAAAAPFIALGAAIAGAGALAIYAYEHFDGFRAVVDAIPGVLSKVTTFLTDTFSPLIEKIGPLFQATFDLAAAIISTAVAVITDLWDRFGARLLDNITIVFNGIREVINGAMQIITGIFDTVKAILTGNWAALWDGIVEIVKGAWELIKGLVNIGFAQVKALFEVAKGVISAAWSLIWNALKTLFSDAWDKVKEAVKFGLDEVAGFVSGIVDKVKKAWNDIWSGLKDAFNNAWKDVKHAVSTAAGEIVDFFTEVIPDMAKAGLHIAAEFGKAIVRGIKNLAGDILSAAKSIIPSPGDIVGGVKDAAIGGVKKGISVLNPFDADGGMFPGLNDAGFYTRVPRWRLAGEAGREVVLPLERPGRLAQLVNMPEVRPVIQRALGDNRTGAPSFHIEMNMPPVMDDGQLYDAFTDRLRSAARGGAQLAPAMSH